MKREKLRAGWAETSLWEAVSSRRGASPEDWFLQHLPATLTVLNSSAGWSWILCVSRPCSCLCRLGFLRCLRAAGMWVGPRNSGLDSVAIGLSFCLTFWQDLTSFLRQEALFLQHCVPYCPAYLFLEARTVTRWLYNAALQELTYWAMLSLLSVHEACGRPCLGFGVFM